MAVIIQPGKENKYIPNAVRFKGVFLGMRVANHKLPKLYVSSRVIDSLGLTEEEVVKVLEQKDYHEKITSDPRLSQIVFKWGEHPDLGYRVITHEQYLEEKAQAEWAEGVSFYYAYGDVRTDTRIPRQIWAKHFKPHARYVRGDGDDMEWYDDQYPGVSRHDIKGWVYSLPIFDTLAAAGIKMTLDGFPISSASQFHEVRQKAIEAREAARAEEREIKRKARQFVQELHGTTHKAMTEQEAAAVAKTEKITLGAFKGPDIYGGGSWFHLQGEDLIYVRNNGMDGDNWAYNNYPTGGAGAVAMRIPGGKSWLDAYSEWLAGLGENLHVVENM